MEGAATSSWMNPVQRYLLLIGRGLLGLYFIGPGLQKVFAWDAMSAYMAAHDVPFIPVLLALTTVIQVGGGACLLIGYRAQWMAFILAGLTLVINFYMHDFWNLEEGLQRMHETQNFVKNLGIMAGLLCLAGMAQTQQGKHQ